MPLPYGCDVSHFASVGISKTTDRGIRKEPDVPATDHDLKYIACAAIVPDCGFTATAATEEDLLKKVAAHAAHDHGITEVTPELLTAVKAAIQNR
jgi:predicted small metal-binding protein